MSWALSRQYLSNQLDLGLIDVPLMSHQHPNLSKPLRKVARECHFESKALSVIAHLDDHQIKSDHHSPKRLYPHDDRAHLPNDVQ